MKHFLSALTIYVLLSFGINAFGQTRAVSFAIQPPLENADYYQSVLEKASLESFRLRDADRALNFDNGFTVKLFSASKIVDLGIDVEIDSYPEKSTLKNSVAHIFSITDDGFITVRSQIDSGSKLAKIGVGFPSKNRIVITRADFDSMPKSKQDIILSRPHQYKVE